MCLLLFFLLYILLVLFLLTFFLPLPINDAGSVRYRSTPWMTFSLIIINSLVFLVWLAPDLYQAQELTTDAIWDYITKVWTYGYRETVIRDGTGLGAFTTFTSMFMHADLWHLFGNMVFLWAFGRRIEDACGHWRFLAFYLLAGMVANMGGALLNPAEGDRPGIGASGAIAGVMGAYLLLYPGATVVALWGIGSILRVPYAAVKIGAGDNIPLWRWSVSLPAWLLLEFALENTIPSLEVIVRGTDSGGVNYLAHLTGFLAALTIFLFVRKDLLTRYIAGRSL
jgi:membrane associated rhomboid family serine protease